MAEPVILYRCPVCRRWFDSPSVCLHGGVETVAEPTPAVVPKQKLAELVRRPIGGQTNGE